MPDAGASEDKGRMTMLNTVAIRRKQREEDRQLWRNTQRQIDELTVTVVRFGTRVDQLSETIEQLAQESRESDRRLGERIDALISAIGAMAIDYDRRLKAVVAE